MSNVAHITTRDLIILILVFTLTLPIGGFKFAQWYFVDREDSYVTRVVREASVVVDQARDVKATYKQEKDELINQPAFCVSTKYDYLFKAPFPRQSKD